MKTIYINIIVGLCAIISTLVITLTFVDTGPKEPDDTVIAPGDNNNGNEDNDDEDDKDVEDQIIEFFEFDNEFKITNGIISTFYYEEKVIEQGSSYISYTNLNGTYVTDDTKEYLIKNELIYLNNISYESKKFNDEVIYKINLGHEEDDMFVVDGITYQVVSTSTDELKLKISGKEFTITNETLEDKFKLVSLDEYNLRVEANKPKFTFTNNYKFNNGLVSTYYSNNKIAEVGSNYVLVTNQTATYTTDPSKILLEKNELIYLDNTTINDKKVDLELIRLLSENQTVGNMFMLGNATYEIVSSSEASLVIKINGRQTVITNESFDKEYDLISLDEYNSRDASDTVKFVFESDYKFLSGTRTTYFSKTRVLDIDNDYVTLINADATYSTKTKRDLLNDGELACISDVSLGDLNVNVELIKYLKLNQTIGKAFEIEGVKYEIVSASELQLRLLIDGVSTSVTNASTDLTYTLISKEEYEARDHAFLLSKLGEDGLALLKHYQAIIDETNSMAGDGANSFFLLNAFDSGYNPSTSSHIFMNYLDVSSVTTMHKMLHGNKSVTALNLSSWDTSNVTDMSYAFSNCSVMTSLNLTNWNTSKVTNMDHMFYNMNYVYSLNVSSFDVSNVTSMNSMFYTCSRLTTLQVDDWNVSKVTNMNKLFYKCIKLATLNVENWNTSSLVNIGYMFHDIAATKLTVTNWDVSNVVDFSYMFSEVNVTSLDLSKWNMSNAITLECMFKDADKIKTLNVSTWDTSKVTTLSQTFYGCDELTGLDLTNWDTSKVTSLYYLFAYNGNMKTVGDISNWDTSKVTDFNNVFNNCLRLVSIDVTNWNISSTTSLANLFFNCIRLESLGDLSNWDVSHITDMKSMFYGLSVITYVGDLTNWDVSNVESFYLMFMSCTVLADIGDVEQWNVSETANVGSIFYKTAMTNPSWYR